MSSNPSPEKKQWERVTDMLGDAGKTLGRHWSYNLRADPKRLGFVLSRYKFAAKMAGRERSVLELGCSEGIGVPILSEFAISYTGVDLDGPAIETAKKNWPHEKRRFIEDDFMGKSYGHFDSVISLDVIEHIYPEYESVFWETVAANLGEDGIVVIGTPNITAQAYASPASQKGHVNLFSAERLTTAMKTLFYNVFLFGMNDECMHTGFPAMAHYLLAVGCYRRQ